MGVGYMGDIWEQIRSRGDFRRHNGMHKYILKKYYDPECNGFAKRMQMQMLLNMQIA